MLVRFPHVIPGDEIRVSATTYVTWKKCPDSANARLQGKYGPESRASFLGNLAHRVFSRHLESGEIPAGEFDAVCKEEIGRSGLNYKMAELGMKPSSLTSVIEEVRGLYERFVKLPGEGFEGSEELIEHHADGDVVLVGKLDAVFREELGGHRLVDWKTGEIADADDQLAFYSLLWALDRDELPAFVEAVSVKTGERYHTVPSTPDVQGVCDEVGRMVDQMRRGWEADSPLPRHGGPWCRYCPILDECPEGQATAALLD
ncbi:MAG: PD-(D/E)XK nuclease family protein [Acidimicrobiia bacterium]|jgi:hypothetical protein